MNLNRYLFLLQGFPYPLSLNRLVSGWNTFLPKAIITGEWNWALLKCSKWSHLPTCYSLLESFCLLFCNFSSQFSSHILERNLGLPTISAFDLLFLPLRSFETCFCPLICLKDTWFDYIYDPNLVVNVLQSAQSRRILFGPLYAFIVQLIKIIVKVSISALPDLILTGSNVCHLPTHIM